MAEKKDKNIKVHKMLQLDIYSKYRVHIVIADDLCSARNEFKEELGSTIKPGGYDGLHCYNNDESKWEAYIFLEPDASSPVICHESFHATSRLMRLLGAKLTHASEESYAYLLDHIVDFICAILIELNSKKKKKK